MDTGAARRRRDLRGQRTARGRRRNEGRPNRVPTVTDRAGASTSSVTSVSIASAPDTYENDWDSWMNRPYTAQSPYSLTPTERIRSPSEGGRYGRDGTDVRRPGYRCPAALSRGRTTTTTAPPRTTTTTTSTKPASTAGGCGSPAWPARSCSSPSITASLILGGGDSGSVSATIASPDTSAAPTASAAPEPTAPRAAAPSLPAETVTTVSPAPSPTAAGPDDPGRPARAARTAGRTARRRPPPGTVTYRVTGNRQLIDLVTVIYTDAAGRAADRRQRRAAVVEDGGARSRASS